MRLHGGTGTLGVAAHQCFVDRHVTLKDAVTFARVRGFGGYLRIVGSVPQGAACLVMVALALKE